jgi:uncharacterized tellurite resistance protein B-like protein
MLRAIKRLFHTAQPETRGPAGHERRQLHAAVAVLLHEARRADYAEGAEECIAAELALGDLFGLDRQECAALLEESRARAHELTSFYAPVTVVKRHFSMPDRIRLVEHLWRVAFADGQLKLYEDHYVRKIAHLLYLSNTESVLARNRARPKSGPPQQD